MVDIEELVRIILRTSVPRWRQLWSRTLAAWSSDCYSLAEGLKRAGVDRRLHDGHMAQAERVAVFLQHVGSATAAPRVDALGRMAAADIHREQGRHERAMALYDEAAEVFLRACDRVGWARTRAGRLLSLTWAGEITKEHLAAMDAPQQALEEAHEYLRVAVLELNTGLACQQLGDYRAAIAWFDLGVQALARQRAQERTLHRDRVNQDHMGRGCHQRRAPREKPLDRWNFTGALLINKAITLLWMGKVETAERLFHQASRLFRLVGNSGDEAVAGVNKAIIARSRGYVADGLNLIRWAAERLEANGLHPAAAYARRYHAEILLGLNRADEAHAEAAHALEQVRGLDTPLDLAETLILLARTLVALGDLSSAEERLDEARRIRARLDHLHADYPVALEYARLLLRIGRYQEARELALGLLRPGTRGVTEHHRAEAHIIAAQALLAQGELTLARATARRAVRRGEELRAPEICYQGHAVLARIARREDHAADALVHYDAATRALHRVVEELAFDQRPGFFEDGDKDALYLEAMELAFEGNDWASALAYIERARARGEWRVAIGTPRGGRADRNAAALEADLLRYKVNGEALASMAADDRARDGLLRERKDLEARIRDRLEEQAQREGGAAVPDVATLLQAVPAGKVAIAYAIAGEDLFIWALSNGQIMGRRQRGKVRRIAQLDDAVQLGIDALIRRLNTCNGDQAQMDEVAARWAQSLLPHLADLWEVLVGPVDQEALLPPEGEELAIVPCGALHALPLAALYDGQRYLVERWAAYCVPSCRTLGIQRVARRARRPLLALGNSGDGWLPASPQEATELAALLGGAAYIEQEATSARLRRDGPGSRAIHLSTHGILRFDNPNFSCIELADRPFYGVDARRLDLRGCELVSLSACETGLGRLRGGDEYIGLVRDFGLAGARAVLASLWRVDDALTRDLMLGVYRQVAAGATPAQALRAGQLALLRDASHPLMAHPYAWAGFVVTTFAGDDQADAPATRAAQTRA
jgi:CHAT domain-containing protein/tetratricopeptide (TPR) repeat protein